MSTEPGLTTASLASTDSVVTEPPAAATFAEPFTIVIPAHNEQDGICWTLRTLKTELASIASDYEIIIVDDGSTDRTQSLLSLCDGIRVLRHDSRRGYGAALKAGIREARHALIVITDADGSYPLERIPGLLRLAVAADMVIGARVYDISTRTVPRRVAKWLLRLIAEWMAQQKIPDINSGLRVLRKEGVMRFVHLLPDGFSFTSTITIAMLTNHCRVRFEPITYRPRIGRSKIRPIRDTLQFVQLILRTGMYFAPLRVFLPVAVVMFTGFLAALCYDVIVVHNLTDKTLMLLVAATNLAMFALLADMIDKRSGTR